MPPADITPLNDRESLERYVASLRAYLLKVANSVADGTPPRGDALSDVVQHALVSAIVDIRAGKCRAADAASVRAWIRKILITKYIDRISRRVPPSPLASEIDVSDGGESPSEAAASRELSGLVRLALDRLEERDRAILVWRQDEESTFEEIGARLGITPQGARKAFGSAVSRLKRAYAELGGDVPHAGDDGGRGR